MLQSLLLICSLASCTAPDGATVPQNAAWNRVVIDTTLPPKSAYQPPAGFVLAPDDGRALVQTTSAPLEIATRDFMLRFTQAERIAIYTARRTDAQLDDFLTQMLAAVTIIPSDPTVQRGMAYLVAGNYLTAARKTQILDLSQASP